MLIILFLGIKVQFCFCVVHFNILNLRIGIGDYPKPRIMKPRIKIDQLENFKQSKRKSPLIKNWNQNQVPYLEK